MKGSFFIQYSELFICAGFYNFYLIVVTVKRFKLRKDLTSTFTRNSILLCFFSFCLDVDRAPELDEIPV